jgi:hypothetical protein
MFSWLEFNDFFCHNHLSFDMFWFKRAMTTSITAALAAFNVEERSEYHALSLHIEVYILL